MLKGCVKNFSRVFSKYQNPLLSYERRFSEDKQRAWKENYLKSLSGKSTLYNFYLWLRSGGPLVKNFSFEQDVVNFINTFTCDKFNNTELGDDVIEAGKEFLLASYPKKIDEISLEQRNLLKIKLNTGKIIGAQRFTDAYTPALELLPYLESDERFSSCHSGSISICGILPEKENPVIVTGKCFNDYRKHFFLHSWVECKNPDTSQEYVIDHNLNALMRKDVFYMLYHPSVYERIPQDVFDEDVRAGVLDWINETTSEEFPTLKIYLANRAEGLQIMKKHYESKLDQSVIKLEK